MTNEEDRTWLVGFLLGCGVREDRAEEFAGKLIAAGFHRTPPPSEDVLALLEEARVYSDAYWPRSRRGDINAGRLGENPAVARVLDRLADALESASAPRAVTDAEVEAAIAAGDEHSSNSNVTKRRCKCGFVSRAVDQDGAWVYEREVTPWRHAPLGSGSSTKEQQ